MTMMMMTLRAAEGHEAGLVSKGREGKGAINVDKKPRSKNRAGVSARVIIRHSATKKDTLALSLCLNNKKVLDRNIVIVFPAGGQCKRGSRLAVIKIRLMRFRDCRGGGGDNTMTCAAFDLSNPHFSPWSKKQLTVYWARI